MLITLGCAHHVSGGLAVLHLHHTGGSSVSFRFDVTGELSNRAPAYNMLSSAY